MSVSLLRKLLRMSLGISLSSLPKSLGNSRSHMAKNRIALVCSARSAATKAEGTTNRYTTVERCLGLIVGY